VLILVMFCENYCDLGFIYCVDVEMKKMLVGL
jgi:hypothetical protein